MHEKREPTQLPALYGHLYIVRRQHTVRPCGEKRRQIGLNAIAFQQTEQHGDTAQKFRTERCFLVQHLYQIDQHFVVRYAGTI